ncbi:MAG: hypothetical protein DMC60_06135 [Verrucomicrobia bacterium]|nr:MAG: hypothetical protein DMC60_06135 [Verrucomicrobiota bacterium]
MDVRLFTLESDFNTLAVPSPQKLGSLGLASALDCERRTLSITDAHRYGERFVVHEVLDGFDALLFVHVVMKPS